MPPQSLACLPGIVMPMPKSCERSQNLKMPRRFDDNISGWEVMTSSIIAFDEKKIFKRRQ